MQSNSWRCFVANHSVSLDLIGEGKKIKVSFEFSMELVKKIKTITGARFVSKEKSDDGKAYWTVPRELDLARRVRDAFNGKVHMSEEISDWLSDQFATEETLTKLALAEDADLTRVPDELEYMTENLLPYQRAGIAYAAAALAPLIADQPGLGKTWEAIGAVFEAGLDEGKHLVIAPLTSLETVWEEELLSLQPHGVYTCVGSPLERGRVIAEFMEDEYPAWLIINPAMIQLVNKRGEGAPTPRWPELFEVLWDTIILDECHKAGLRNEKSLMAQGLNALSCSGKRMALSGTPMGGKPINLWPILHWLHPAEFTSKWRWAAQWLSIEETQWGKKIGEIKSSRKDEFNHYITPYMLRRTKSEVLPQLPAKQYVPIWLPMGPKQKKQYDEFAAAAEVRIDDEKLTATGILAEYTRLKQFAIAHSRIRWINKTEGQFRVSPTPESCKLEKLEELLEERGIFEEEQDEPEQVVIFSQFSEVVDWVAEYLREIRGVDVLKITGAVNKKGERRDIQREFQSGDGARVIVMTTTSGGVAITLDRADTVIFMDETWDPDDQEQAEDRIHRASRIHQVTCYYLRTKGTIEQYINQVIGHKQNVNTQILDLRREGLRAV